MASSLRLRHGGRVSQDISVGRVCWLATRVLGNGGNGFCRSRSSCMGWAALAAAAQVVEASTVEAAEATVELDASERSALEEALGFGTKGRSRAKPRLRSRSLKSSNALEPSAFSGMRLIEHSPS